MFILRMYGYMSVRKRINGKWFCTGLLSFRSHKYSGSFWKIGESGVGLVGSQQRSTSHHCFNIVFCFFVHSFFIFSSLCYLLVQLQQKCQCTHSSRERSLLGCSCVPSFGFINIMAAACALLLLLWLMHCAAACFAYNLYSHIGCLRYKHYLVTSAQCVHVYLTSHIVLNVSDILLGSRRVTVVYTV